MPPVLDRADSTVYHDPAAYASHPCVARLANGDLLVAFNESLPRQPRLHPPSDPRFLNLMCRSVDGGARWLPPRVVPDYGATGAECPSITQLDTGGVLLVQWRFAWYPLETARKLAARPDMAGRFVLPSPRSWLGRQPTSDADWEACELPWVRSRRRAVRLGEHRQRGHLGPNKPGADSSVRARQRTGLVHQHDSWDGGGTWLPPRPTPLWGCPAHLLRLSDGRLFALYGVRRPPFGVRASLSADDGASWDAAGELVIRDDMRNGNLGYPTAVEMPDGSLLAAYYGEDAEGVTHIIGSRFRLP